MDTLQPHEPISLLYCSIHFLIWLRNNFRFFAGTPKSSLRRIRSTLYISNHLLYQSEHHVHTKSPALPIGVLYVANCLLYQSEHIVHKGPSTLPIRALYIENCLLRQLKNFAHIAPSLQHIKDSKFIVANFVADSANQRMDHPIPPHVLPIDDRKLVL